MEYYVLTRSKVISARAFFPSGFCLKDLCSLNFRCILYMSICDDLTKYSQYLIKNNPGIFRLMVMNGSVLAYWVRPKIGHSLLVLRELKEGWNLIGERA